MPLIRGRTPPRRLRPGLAVWLILGGLAAGNAAAHDRSQSFSHWQVDGSSLRGEFTIDARRATLLLADAVDPNLALPRLLPLHLHDTVSLQQGPTPCILATPRPLPASPGWLRTALHFECPAALSEQAARLQIDALFRYAATHLHLLRITASGTADDVDRQQLLSPGNNRVHIGGPTTHPAERPSLLWFGAVHVASGLDHVAFLAALLLLVSGWRQRLWTITGFTLGHSLTLSLATLGLIRPDIASLEALIAWSIVVTTLQAARLRSWLSTSMLRRLFAAMACLGGLLWWLDSLAMSAWTWLAATLLLLWTWRHASSSRYGEWPLASAFGLIHGAGFAGALVAAELPPGQLAGALLRFNLGVEIGQLALLGVMVLATGLIRRWFATRTELAAQCSAAVLLALGAYWFALRAVA